MRVIASIAFAALLTSTSCFAADAAGNFAVWGLGGASCHAYTVARKAKKDGPYKTYLMGYLTAFNTLTPNTARVTGHANLNQILDWLDKYCHKSQIDSYESALHHLAVEMNAKGPAHKTTGGTAAK